MDGDGEVLDGRLEGLELRNAALMSTAVFWMGIAED
ncbi:hypothetical protein BCM02_114157 [Paenibacillus methanolicus]|uniref:Uncharacterized protein n=1 Tax=Paenibacillus methanolicus TaxID=582686 RepID=A0A5S5BU20_9BACL|nr:hypothetical protein BCM02_114157 [Paenibacillus methanolicus]